MANNNQSSKPEARAAYIHGLRRIAYALEHNETLPLPYGYDEKAHLNIPVHAFSRDEMQAWVDLADEIIDQNTYEGNYNVEVRVGGVHLGIYAGGANVGGAVERDGEHYRVVGVEPFAQREVAR